MCGPQLLSPGDTDYKRRELREGWKERRATGIIGKGTEQDAFVIDAVGEFSPSSLLTYILYRRQPAD